MEFQNMNIFVIAVISFILAIFFLLYGIRGYMHGQKKSLNLAGFFVSVLTCVITIIMMIQNRYVNNNKNDIVKIIEENDVEQKNRGAVVSLFKDLEPFIGDIHSGFVYSGITKKDNMGNTRYYEFHFSNDMDEDDKYVTYNLERKYHTLIFQA